MSKAIILLSGGIDSCVVLALALSQNKECISISFEYGQRHKIELDAARSIAKHYEVPHTVLKIDPNLFACSSSSLLRKDQPIEKNPTNIPSTYVPGRNLLFIAHAATFAEIHGASEIHFGANADDEKHYPDCKSTFLNGIEQALSHTFSLQIFTPLIHLSKNELIELGKKLQAPLMLTWSCYNPQKDRPCTKCLACRLRSNI